MKKNELKNLREKSVKELVKLVSDKQQESAQRKAEMSVGKHKNIRFVKNIRRDLAVIMTVLKEKEVNKPA